MPNDPFARIAASERAEAAAVEALLGPERAQKRRERLGYPDLPPKGVYDAQAADPLGFHLVCARSELCAAQDEPRYGPIRQQAIKCARDDLSDALLAAEDAGPEAVLAVALLLNAARRAADDYRVGDGTLDEIAAGIARLQAQLAGELIAEREAGQ